MQNVKRNILISTPAYAGQISTSTIVGVTSAIAEGREHGWDVRYLPLIGSADIADTRNQILGLFLHAEQCDELLLVDADIGFGPGCLTHIMSHKVDLVGGIYRQRRDTVDYPLLRLSYDQQMIEDPETGFPLIEVRGIPAGFMRITRKCLDAMCESKDTRWVSDKDKIRGIQYPFLFDWTWSQKDFGWERMSEDYSFCQRFRDVGGKVWADPALKLDHVGQKVFSGDFMSHIQTEMMAPGIIAA